MIIALCFLLLFSFGVLVRVLRRQRVYKDLVAACRHLGKIAHELPAVEQTELGLARYHVWKLLARLDAAGDVTPPAEPPKDLPGPFPLLDHFAHLTRFGDPSSLVPARPAAELAAEILALKADAGALLTDATAMERLRRLIELAHDLAQATAQ